jgi:hypothetical protein
MGGDAGLDVDQGDGVGVARGATARSAA